MATKKKKDIRNINNIKIERVYGDKPFMECIKEFTKIKLMSTDGNEFTYKTSKC